MSVGSEDNPILLDDSNLSNNSRLSDPDNSDGDYSSSSIERDKSCTTLSSSSTTDEFKFQAMTRTSTTSELASFKEDLSEYEGSKTLYETAAFGSSGSTFTTTQDGVNSKSPHQQMFNNTSSIDDSLITSDIDENKPMTTSTPFINKEHTSEYEDSKTLFFGTPPSQQDVDKFEFEFPTNSSVTEFAPLNPKNPSVTNFAPLNPKNRDEKSSKFAMNEEDDTLIRDEFYTTTTPDQSSISIIDTNKCTELQAIQKNCELPKSCTHFTFSPTSSSSKIRTTSGSNSASKVQNTSVDIYLVGTAHFSRQSQNDVAQVIRDTRPNIVMLELCQSRSNILQFDEETLLLRMKRKMTSKIIMEHMRKEGALVGALSVLMQVLSAKITKQMGMPPGGEFRTAFKEVQSLNHNNVGESPWGRGHGQSPHCLIHLGDRPIGVTLRRAFNSISFVQKLKFAFNMIFSNVDDVSESQIEEMKNRDVLESLMLEMSGQFPTITRVFVDERDMFLAHSLQMACEAALRIKCCSCLSEKSVNQEEEGHSNPIVVGVVGAGHVSGIQKHFGRITAEDVRIISTIPNNSKGRLPLRRLLGVSTLALICYYGIYKGLILNNKLNGGASLISSLVAKLR